PKVIVTFVLENGGGGSSNGAPVVRQIFDHVILGKKEEEPKAESKEEVIQP
ncbi:TPA: hypothetical protein O4I39_003347, partial [Vibrio cholerae]|nr:hypothetical protein [Vibrio cholerae]